MPHGLIYYPHETLLQTAKPVKKFDAAFAALLEDMRAAMDAKKGVGIAAPQVGASARCFHVRYDEEIITFVNPVITSVSSDLSFYEEGCLSIPGVYAEVERPVALHIEACDARGRAFSLDADEFLARVIQHEFDHLNGVLFIDRISKTSRRLALKAYDKKNPAEFEDEAEAAD